MLVFVKNAPRRVAVVAACIAAFSGGTGIAGEHDALALRTSMPRGITLGAALNRDTIEGKDAVSAAIVTKHFDTVTSENILKWALVHPEPNRYDFGPADAYVELGRKQNHKVIGHTLVWHNQTPKWVFEDKDGKRVDRDTLLARMREHIRTVVGRYRGRIAGWDVCNEVITEDGAMRKSPWFEIAGEEYIAEAFKAAQEADPEAEQYYNDYNLYKPAKRAAAIALVKKLREQGLRVDALGEQGHWQLATPTTAEIQAIFDDIAAAGVPVVITELDVDVLARDAAMAGADLATVSTARTPTIRTATACRPTSRRSWRSATRTCSRCSSRTRRT